MIGMCDDNRACPAQAADGLRAGSPAGRTWLQPKRIGRVQQHDVEIARHAPVLKPVIEQKDADFRPFPEQRFRGRDTVWIGTEQDQAKAPARSAGDRA